MLLVLLAVSVLPACGGENGAVDETQVPGPTAAGAPLVEMMRYGGKAGVTERVSVDASGRATVVSDRSVTPRTRTLTPSEFADLRRALERSQIAALERDYLDPRAFDAYQYDVTYQGVTVTADEAVLPATLRPVVDQLVRLLR